MTPRSASRAVVLALAALPLVAAAEPGRSAEDASLARAGGGAGLRAACWLDPCRLSGDFDGDGKPDRAVLVEAPGGRRGIAFLHAGGDVTVVGAGHAIGNGGDDFHWMDEWHVMGAGERASLREIDPTLPRGAGDALHVAKREAASAMIHWTGRGYAWHQLGD